MPSHTNCRPSRQGPSCLRGSFLASLSLVATRGLESASRLILLAALLGSVGAGACYRGYDLEDKEPPPGHAGGACLMQGCYDMGQCYEDEQICYDPADPCKGIYCGGNGVCGVDIDTGLPFCQCDPGFSNETYAFYCM